MGEGTPLDGFNTFIGNFAFTSNGATVSGFLGGIAAGFLAGGIILVLKKLTAGFPKSLEGIKPVLIYPLCGVFIIGVLMCFILNPIIGLINVGLSSMLTALQAANLIAVLGLILGAMMAIDMGGPINKAAYVFGTGMLGTAQVLMEKGAEANDPAVVACYIAMASIMVGGMVPPVGIAIACKLFPSKFTESERETWITNIVMGSSGIAGLLSAIFGCTLMAPHGGVFVFATVGKWPLYILAWLIGSFITAVMLGLIKKPVNK